VYNDTVDRFLNIIGNPEEIKRQIKESAMRRGFGSNSTNTTKLHLLKEIGEMVKEWDDQTTNMGTSDGDGKPIGFWSEFADVIILCISGQELYVWKLGDSIHGISGRHRDLFLQVFNYANKCEARNCVAHTMIEWLFLHHDIIFIDKVANEFKRKIEYNKIRKD